LSAPWLDSYPEGVPAEIDPGEYRSIIEILEQSCSRHKDRAAFVNFGTSLTYEELDTQTRNFAAWLQKKGLKKGDRVALVMPNILQYPVALFGALRAGLVIVNTNPMYTAREMKHQLVDSGARAIVIVENVAHVLTEICNEVPVEFVITTKIGDLLKFPKGLLINLVAKYVKKAIPEWNLPGSVSFSKALREGKNLKLTKVEMGHEDLAFLQYTGGTTGVAKGAMLTHRNMVANMLQSGEWMKAAGIGNDAEIVITALPLYHIFALTANCLVHMASGGTNILITDPRDMPAFVKELSKVPFSVIPGVNTLFNGLLNTPGFAELDFSTLKGALGGGMAVQRAVANRWKEVTELVVRGPQVMKGYWQRPEETTRVITRDGWLLTGDIAMMTADGFFKIVDRKKDMILVSGFNVYPNEIEDVIAHHPKVLEVAAIGVPDEKSVEAVKVFIVKSDPSLDEQEMREYCAEQFTGYKRPRHIEFRDDLPKSNVGKILRRELRDEELKK